MTNQNNAPEAIFNLPEQFREMISLCDGIYEIIEPKPLPNSQELLNCFLERVFHARTKEEILHNVPPIHMEAFAARLTQGQNIKDAFDETILVHVPDYADRQVIAMIGYHIFQTGK